MKSLPNLPSSPGVYLISHPSGWFYIGSSNDLNRRAKEHVSQLRRGAHLARSLQSAFDGLAEVDFEYQIAEDRDEAYKIEESALRHYATDVFLANNEISIRERSDSTRAKISESLKGHAVSEHTRKRVGQAATGNKYWVGRKHKDSSKAKMSRSQAGNQNAKGWSPTPEQIAKRAASMEGFRHSEESKTKMSENSHAAKSVVFKGQVFSSYKEAGVAAGLSADTVRRRVQSNHPDWQPQPPLEKMRAATKTEAEAGTKSDKAVSPADAAKMLKAKKDAGEALSKVMGKVTESA